MNFKRHTPYSTSSILYVSVPHRSETQPCALRIPDAGFICRQLQTPQAWTLICLSSAKSAATSRSRPSASLYSVYAQMATLFEIVKAVFMKMHVALVARQGQSAHMTAIAIAWHRYGSLGMPVEGMHLLPISFSCRPTACSPFCNLLQEAKPPFSPLPACVVLFLTKSTQPSSRGPNEASAAHLRCDPAVIRHGTMVIITISKRAPKLQDASFLRDRMSCLPTLLIHEPWPCCMA